MQCLRKMVCHLIASCLLGLLWPCCLQLLKHKIHTCIKELWRKKRFIQVHPGRLIRDIDPNTTVRILSKDEEKLMSKGQETWSITVLQRGNKAIGNKVGINRVHLIPTNEQFKLNISSDENIKLLQLHNQLLNILLKS